MDNMLEREMEMVLEDELMRLASVESKVAQVMKFAWHEVMLRLQLDGFGQQMALAGITDYVGYCRDLALLGVRDELPTDANTFYEGACAFVEDLICMDDLCAQAA